VALAAPEQQGSFPSGAVVALQGTPHLWIADESGMLHWGGDTRALQGRRVDWSTRVEVSLDTLKTLRRGDPYLSAGLLKDGEPIYLVKWETSETVPRLLHVQCIADVELFGINERNYATLVIDRPDWERQFGIQASTLQKAELAGADPTAPSCGGRPKLKITSEDLARLTPALQQYGLTPSDVNVDKTVSFGLPDSVLDPGRESILLMSAPLMQPPTQAASDLNRSGRGIAIGVLKVGRQLIVSDLAMSPNVYLVVVRGGRDMAMVYVPGGPNPRELATLITPQVLRMGRDVTVPQTVMTGDSVCWSWRRIQVCSVPSPKAMMTGSEQNRMNAVMNAAVGRLVTARRLNNNDIDVSGTLPDIEGTSAVDARRASMLAAPINGPSQFTPTPFTSDPTGGRDVNILIGALYVERDVEIPGYTTVPRGDYAVRAKRTSGNWTAELIDVDARRIEIGAQNVEVLAELGVPTIAVVNLAIAVPSAAPPISLCLFREECL
jgi:hypothetical protein